MPSPNPTPNRPTRAKSTPSRRTTKAARIAKPPATTADQAQIVEWNDVGEIVIHDPEMREKIYALLGDKKKHVYIRAENPHKTTARLSPLVVGRPPSSSERGSAPIAIVSVISKPPLPGLRG